MELGMKIYLTILAILVILMAIGFGFVSLGYKRIGTTLMFPVPILFFLGIMIFIFTLIWSW